MKGNSGKVLARHVRSNGNPYEVLGLGPEASDDALRKSQYRREVQDTHPDRLIARGVPEEFVRIANDRLAALNEAWAQIRAEEGGL